MDEHRRLVVNVLNTLSASSKLTRDDVECAHIALFGVPPPLDFDIDNALNLLTVRWATEAPSTASMFAAVDRTQRGHISAHDLMAAVNEYNANPNEYDSRVGRIELSMIQRMFDGADDKRNGKVNRKQFNKITQLI